MRKKAYVRESLLLNKYQNKEKFQSPKRGILNIGIWPYLVLLILAFFIIVFYDALKPGSYPLRRRPHAKSLTQSGVWEDENDNYYKLMDEKQGFT